MINPLFNTLAEATAQSQGPNAFFFLELIALGVIFYFLLIRPQQKRLIAAIKTGDKVVTNSGMHGIISNVKETTVLVKVADNVKIEFDKAAIASITKTPEA